MPDTNTIVQCLATWMATLILNNKQAETHLKSAQKQHVKWMFLRLQANVFALPFTTPENISLPPTQHTSTS